MSTKQKSAAPTKDTTLLIYKLISQSDDLIVAYIVKYRKKYFFAELKSFTNTKLFDLYLMSIDYPTPPCERDLYPLLKELRTKDKGYMLQVTKTGWHKSCFLYGSNVIGKSEFEPYGKLNIGINTNISCNISKFKSQFKTLLSTNSIPVFLFGALLAATIKSRLPCRQDNWGALIVGAGSDGKTTFLHLLGSFIGNYQDYCLNSNTTRENLELDFATYSDLPILFDDLGNLKNSSATRSLANLIKSFSQGRTKSFLSQSRDQIRGHSYSSVLIATSNSTINDLEQSIDDTHNIRLINVYADCTYRLFDNLCGFETPEKLVLHLQTQALTPNPILKAFIEKLIPYLDDVDFWQGHVNEIMQIESLLTSQGVSDNKLARTANYFAQATAALDLANQLLDLGIENHYENISKIYSKWQATFNSERWQPKQQLINFINSNLDSTIVSIKSKAIKDGFGFFDDTFIYLNSDAINSCFINENKKLSLVALEYEYIQKKLCGINTKYYRFDKTYLNN